MGTSPLASNSSTLPPSWSASPPSSSLLFQPPPANAPSSSDVPRRRRPTPELVVMTNERPRLFEQSTSTQKRSSELSAHTQASPPRHQLVVRVDSLRQL